MVDHCGGETAQRAKISAEVDDRTGEAETIARVGEAVEGEGDAKTVMVKRLKGGEDSR